MKKERLRKMKNYIREELKNNEIQLSEEQQKLFNVMEKTNEMMYITGNAGSGKSELLKYFMKNTKKRVIVLAPTGVAALNVAGQTIHSFFQLRFGIQDLKNLENTRLSTKTKEILNLTDTIIIDEISMVSPDMIEMINLKCQIARNNDRLPFGGIQFICFGDLFQLPPVISDKENYRYLDDIYGGIFFFNAPVIKNNELSIYELKHIFRQDDLDFKKILNQLRKGNSSKEILDIINSRVITDELRDETIILATTNATANKINKDKLEEIDSEEHIFVAEVDGDFKENDFPTEKQLTLKVGAQVMMLVNDKSKRWVNGTIGVITELSSNAIKVRINNVEHTVDKHTWNNYKYNYDYFNKSIEQEIVSSFQQFPIKLAWAITIHKSQGKTYNSVLIDLGNGTFDAGQLYVALSRCVSLDKLYLTKKVTPNDIKVNSEVVKFMSEAKIIDLKEKTIIGEQCSLISEEDDFFENYKSSSNNYQIDKSIDIEMNSINEKVLELLGKYNNGCFSTLTIYTCLSLYGKISITDFFFHHLKLLQEMKKIELIGYEQQHSDEKSIGNVNIKLFQEVEVN